MRKSVIKSKNKFLTFEESRQKWSSGFIGYKNRPLDPVARLEFDANMVWLRMQHHSLNIPH
jgi:hypothetical protein